MTSGDTVTAVIPSLPSRSRLLTRAVASVAAQTHPVTALAVAVDTKGGGAWATRNRAVKMARDTEWVAFLDDDDEWLPHHIEHLLTVAADTAADVVWGWFDVVGGTDPFPHYRGRQYDPADPHIVPITYLVRSLLLQHAVNIMGGFQPDSGGSWDVQDRPLLDAFYALGATMHADPKSTWLWHHHTANTSGLPTRAMP